MNVKWKKSVIGDNQSNHAIMLGNYHIARFSTVINGGKVEKYLVSDCSGKLHIPLRWFGNSEDAKSFAENLTSNK